MKSVAAQVKQLRKRHQLSQTALARMLGVGLNTVYLWEKAATQPRAGVRARLLHMTKCSEAEVKALLRKAGLKEGMKKPGRKPKRAAPGLARRRKSGARSGR
jgi:transcriptional regulator with XRE-family HTH domain